MPSIDGQYFGKVIKGIRKIKVMHGIKNDTHSPRWPMIVLRSPKGWTDRR